MKKLREWFGIGLRGELEKARIALSVAREIGDDWKLRASEAQAKLIESTRENERLKIEYSNLSEEHEQQKRCSAIIGKALGKVTGQALK